MLKDTVGQVFAKKSYCILAVVVSLFIFALSTWLPNLRLIGRVLGSRSATLVEKAEVLVGLLGAIKTNFTTLSAIYTVLIAMLFGVNIALVTYYIKQRRQYAVRGNVATSFGGLLSGIVGIGCAACGTLVLGPIFALLGAGGLVAMLPFGGQEFGIIGVVLLGFSVMHTSKKIQEPAVCTPSFQPTNKTG